MKQKIAVALCLSCLFDFSRLAHATVCDTTNTDVSVLTSKQCITSLFGTTVLSAGVAAGKGFELQAAVQRKLNEINARGVFDTFGNIHLRSDDALLRNLNSITDGDYVYITYNENTLSGSYSNYFQERERLLEEIKRQKQVLNSVLEVIEEDKINNADEETRNFNNLKKEIQEKKIANLKAGADDLFRKIEKAKPSYRVVEIPAEGGDVMARARVKIDELHSQDFYLKSISTIPSSNINKVKMLLKGSKGGYIAAFLSGLFIVEEVSAGMIADFLFEESEYDIEIQDYK